MSDPYAPKEQKQILETLERIAVALEGIKYVIATISRANPPAPVVEPEAPGFKKTVMDFIKRE